MKNLSRALALLALVSSPVAAQQFVPIGPFVSPIIGLPNASNSVQGTGISGLDTLNGVAPHWFIYDAPTAFDSVNNLRLDRIVPTGTTGVGGNTYSALWLNGSTPSSNAGYEWLLKSTLANTALGTGGAQNVAINGTVTKNANASGSVSYSAGGNFVCQDNENRNDPSYGCLGAEIGVGVGYATTDANAQRVILLLNAGGVAGATISHGMNIGTNSGVTLGSGVSFDGGLGTYNVGLDLTGATFAKIPIACATGQCLGFDTNPTTKAANHTLYYNGGYLQYVISGAQAMLISDSGDVTHKGRVQVSASAPTVSTCGTGGVIDGNSSANGGKFLIGTGATACTLTFAAAYPNNAYCTVVPMSAPAAIANVPYISAIAKTGFTVSGGTAGVNYLYTCFGN